MGIIQKIAKELIGSDHDERKIYQLEIPQSVVLQKLGITGKVVFMTYDYQKRLLVIRTE